MQKMPLERKMEALMIEPPAKTPVIQSNSPVSGTGLKQPCLIASEKLTRVVCDTLPDGYLMRGLQASDYELGYLDCLAQLTTVGTISKTSFQERFDHMLSRPGEYNIIVIEELATKKIVASGTLLVESKFIRQCGKVGHIEDIVVHESQRGKNFGKKLVDQLTHIGKEAGCYKIILCCDEKNVGFYEKCSYKAKEIEMVLYF